MKIKKILLSTAGLMLIQMVVSHIFISMRGEVLQQIHQRKDETYSELKGLYDQVHFLGNIYELCSFALAILLIILMILLINKINKSSWQHSTCWGGLSLYVISQFFMISIFFLRGEMTINLNMLSFMRSITQYSSFLLFTLVIATTIPNRLARWSLPLISAGMIIVKIGIWYLILAEKYSEMETSYPFIFLVFNKSSLLLSSAFVLSCLWSGLRGQYDTDIRQRIQCGDLLRRLIKLCFVRVTISVISTITLMLGLNLGGDVNLLFIILTLFSVACGSMIMYTLIAFAQAWRDTIGQSKHLKIVIGCVFIVLIGELLIFPIGMNFLGMIAKIKTAISSWDMPSQNQIASSQAIITWGGQGMQLIGLIATWNLLKVLKEYTLRKNHSWLTLRANTVTTLLLTSAVCSTLFYILAATRGNHPFILLLGGLVVLGIAVYFLVTFYQFALGVATSLDFEVTHETEIQTN